LEKIKFNEEHTCIFVVDEERQEYIILDYNFNKFYWFNVLLKNKIYNKFNKKLSFSGCWRLGPIPNPL